MATPAEPEGADSTVAPTAKSPRRFIIWGVAAALAVVAGTYGYRRFSYSQSHETTDNAQIDGHIIPILARVGGYVSAIKVAENDTVQGGQVLVQIDDSEYRQRLAAAEADLQAAIATAGAGRSTGQAQAQVATASGQQASLQAQITAARANAQRAASDLARAEDLAQKQIISRQQLDGIRAQVQALNASVVSLEAQANAAGANITSAEAGVRLAQARVLAARAARENAALQLQYTTLVAPEGGMVARKSVEVGQLVQPGQPLMTVVGDTGVWVTANLKETQLQHTHVGQVVELHLDAYEDCVAKGRVASISSATGAKFALLPPDNATGNFTKVVQRIPVRVAVTSGCGPNRPLRPGMSVTASIETRGTARTPEATVGSR